MKDSLGINACAQPVTILVRFTSKIYLVSNLATALQMLCPPVIFDKNKMPIWAFDFCGGDEGIRTLDTVARIPHFQCGALDQLCDISEYYKLFFVGIVIINIVGNQFRRIYFGFFGCQCAF